ncbi:MAG: amidohydrolase [Thermoplasmata archaeon]|nr:amidohydrolase [Candidatus Sysuiplasma acidicola]
MSPIYNEAHDFEGDIIAIRRKIHRKPELSFQENETAALVASTLKSIGIPVRTGVGGKGVVGLLNGASEGKCIALRADMDALPLEESAPVEFRSERQGIMHACGHDTHVAMLLGAAMLLKRHESELRGPVKLIFQPAEEHGGRGGAGPMIDDGVMSSPKVSYVFGLHISSAYPSGTFALRPGPIMASPDSFRIRVMGKGGHGSAPHMSIDPVFIAAQVVSSLQGISSRFIDPIEPFVLSVCSIHGGTKDNIIPDEVTLEGTIRTFSTRTRLRAKSLTSSIAKSICRSFGAGCEVSFMENAYPVTVNNRKATERVRSLLRNMESGKVIETDPVMGGEDFSRFLQKAPGTFYFLGTMNEAKGCVYPNHSSMFTVDEDVLRLGTASLAEIALHFLP